MHGQPWRSHPWETLSSISRVIVASEYMGTPQGLGTGCCHHEGSCPVPCLPGHPSFLPARPATSLLSPLAQQQLPALLFFSWDSELEQHRRRCGVGKGGSGQEGGGQGRDAAHLPWRHCDVPLAYPTLLQQHQDGVAHLFFTKEETHGGLFFLMTVGLCSFSLKLNYFLY